MSRCKITKFGRCPLPAALAVLFSASVPAAITLDGTLGTSGTLTGPNYAIPESVGQTRGNNLFHSFGQFSLTSSESATFTGSANISNVIARVTGGSVSSIDGTISFTISGANLYLINPSGIVFGQNARLDISGSFHASTADYLTFTDGGRFDARTPANSVLTSAAPQAFGFLGNQTPRWRWSCPCKWRMPPKSPASNVPAWSASSATRNPAKWPAPAAPPTERSRPSARNNRKRAPTSSDLYTQSILMKSLL